MKSIFGVNRKDVQDTANKKASLLSVLINVIIILCLIATIAAAIFGILAVYFELITREPLYNIYMKIAALLIGIAGIPASLISALREKLSR
jgi:uncharacterized membrane protein